MSEPKTADDWCRDYERNHQEHVRYTNKLEALLADLLSVKGLEHHLIESRTKAVSSFREKMVRMSKTYSNPLIDMTDLTGIRIIAYYQDDIGKIGRLIEDEFEVDEKNSVEHLPSEAEFGYISSHYVIRLSDARAHLLEWGGLGALKAEIQVRTVLQHAWAAISHKLQYKREQDVPAQLRRKLFRLSALFEIADDEFISLRDASNTVSRAIDSQLSRGDRNIPIDYISLSQFVENSTLVAELSGFAERAGFVFDRVEAADGSDGDSISDLVQLSANTNISTVAQFESELRSSLPWVEKYLRTQYEYNDEPKGNRWYATPAFICELVLIRMKISKLRPSSLFRLGWSEGIAVKVFEVARSFSNEN